MSWISETTCRCCTAVIVPVWVLMAGIPNVGTAQEDSVSRRVHSLLARRCFACHGPAEHKAGVALQTRKLALSKSEHGHLPVVPGDPGASELIRRVISTDDAERMPPEGPPLSAVEVELLRTWIRNGAAYEKHWSLTAPVRPVPPPVHDTLRVQNPIDQFVQAKLQREGLQPSPEAGRAKLVRRLFIDLTGLLPPGDEIQELLNDTSVSSYAELVDRLLASAHFGERWGRHWLDLARYADSFGYERDDVRPNAWRYRDWVISSINRNQPFDDFILEQLAGDLFENPGREQLIATGLHRMNIKNNESGINKEDYRNRETVDRVNTTGTALLGLTIGCAQCHTHKYDPISQSEYYRLYAFFNNAGEKDIDIEGTPRERERYQLAKNAYEARKKRLESRKSLIDSMRRHSSPGAWLKSLDDNQAVSLLELFDISGKLIRAVCNASSATPPDPAVREFWSSLEVRQDETRKAIRQLSVEQRHLPKPYIMTLAESTKNRRPTHVLLRGDFKQQGETVTAGTPAVLNPLSIRGEAGDRLDLAKWIVSRDNPLTARVAVNHIWMHLFGSGIVATPDDFGTQGAPPTHPGLLDWLAVEFMESGWDRRHLIRTIVLSATYRQDSAVDPVSSAGPSTGRKTAAVIDPENRLLSRQSRFRVEAEVIRDLFLDAAGLLYPAIGGPTIHPELPPAVNDLGYKYRTRWLTSNRPQRYRRGLYIHFKRTNPYPSLILFDGPESNLCQAKRNRSNTPLQALATLNDPVFVECAQALGHRLALLPGSDESRLQSAGRMCLTRPFQPREVQALQQLLAAERAAYAAAPQAAAELAGNSAGGTVSDSEAAAWIAVSRTILNLDEFITRE